MAKKKKKSKSNTPAKIKDVKKITNLLPMAKVESMWKAYQKKQTVFYVSKETGIHRTTVAKYVNFGDQVRGIESFQQRMARLTQEIEKKEDSANSKIRKENLSIARALKGKLAKALKDFEFDPKRLGTGEVQNILNLEMMLVADEANEQNKEKAVLNEVPQFPDDLLEHMAHTILFWQGTGKIPKVELGKFQARDAEDEPPMPTVLENGVVVVDAEAKVK